jgi:hypothetical protein
MAKKTIERSIKDADNPYRMVSRSAMEDDRLTFEARGVLAYILVKPDNWHVQVADLRRAGNLGRDKTYRILNELIAFGYVVREIERQADGTIGDTIYRVNEKPTKLTKPSPEKPYMVSPLPEKPDTAEPDTAEPLPVNTDHNNKEDQLIKKLTNKESSSSTVHDDEQQRITKALSAALQQAGIGLNELIFEQYTELVANYGMPAVLRGIQSAAENNKQHRFRYVQTCVINAAQGTTPSQPAGSSKSAADVTFKEWLLRTYNTTVTIGIKPESELQHEYKAWRAAQGLASG